VLLQNLVEVAQTENLVNGVAREPGGGGSGRELEATDVSFLGGRTLADHFGISAFES
jgi:hypothetical protein